LISLVSSATANIWQLQYLLILSIFSNKTKIFGA